MRWRLALLAVCAAAPASLYAADIAGAVKEPSNRPANGAQLSITCPGSDAREGRANAYGRYRIAELPNLKWCQIRVSYRGKTSNAVRTNSGSGSKDINLRLRAGNGGWKLTL